MVRAEQNAYNPLAIGRSAKAIALSQSNGGGTIGLAQIDRIVRAAPLAKFSEYERLSIRRQVRDQHPVKPGEITLFIFPGPRSFNRGRKIAAPQTNAPVARTRPHPPN